MLYEINGKVYRRIKEQEYHSCKGCVADSEYNHNTTQLCFSIQDTCGKFNCNANPITGETGRIYEEATSFYSTKELWEWVLAGNKIKYKPTLSGVESHSIIYMEHDTVYLNNEYQKTHYQLGSYSMYMPVSSTTELNKWYDSIPEQGIICWVSAVAEDKKEAVRVVYKYNYGEAFPYQVSLINTTSWLFATPLTKEELLERCYDR